MASLVRLRDVKDSKAIGPGGRTIEARMQKTAKDAVKDIEECAADCDMYSRKSTLVKVLKGQSWQVKLEDWIAVFSNRKNEFQFALAAHTGKAVNSLKESADKMNHRYVALHPSIA